MAMNKITFIGNLTRDPEMKEIAGAQCANFTVASSTRTKGADGNPITNFYNCTAWRQAGETICKYLKKGSKVGIIGDLCLRPYKDSNGNDRMSPSVTVTDFEFLNSRSESSDNSQPAQQQPRRDAATGYTLAQNDDTLPF